MLKETKIRSNIRGHQAALERLVKVQRKFASETLRDEARLTGIMLIQYSPFPGVKRGTQKKTVRKDVKNALRPIKSKDFDQPVYQKLIRSKDEAGLNELLIKAGSKRRFVPFNKGEISKPKDENKRVLQPQYRLTTATKKVQSNINLRHQGIGRAKGGWAAGVMRLGGRPAKYVRVHAEAGKIEEQSYRKDRPYIRLINESGWAKTARAKNQVAYVRGQRAKKIEAKIERIYAKHIEVEMRKQRYRLERIGGRK